MTQRRLLWHTVLGLAHEATRGVDHPGGRYPASVSALPGAGDIHCAVNIAITEGHAMEMYVRDETGKHVGRLRYWQLELIK